MNAIHYLVKTLSNKNTLITVISICFLLPCSFLCFSENHTSVSNQISDNDTIQIKKILNKAYANWSVSTDSMLYYIKQAEKKLKNTTYENGLVRLYNLYGIYYWTKSEHLHALENYMLSVAKAKEIGNQYAVSLGEINIAMVYLSLEEFDKSLQYFELGLAHLPKTEKAKLDEVEALNGIGVIYERTNRIEKAISFYEKCLNYAHETKDTILMAQQFSNLGSALFKLNKINEAKKYQELALKNYRLKGINRGVSQTSLRLAELLTSQRKFNEALIKVDSALAIAISNESKDLICESLYQKAKIFKLKGDKSKSISVLRECHSYLKYANPSFQLSILIELAETYEENKQIKEALEYRKIYDAKKDSVSNNRMKQEIYKAEIDFEIRKNQLELEKNISAENAKKWFNYFFILLVGSLIIIAMLYYSRLTIEREMAQKSFESLEKEYKNITLSNIKLNQEIEFKSRELANHTLNMVHRNNLLREIKENLLGLRKEQEFQKNEKLQSIINYVNHCLNQEKDWMIFKSQFDNLNKAFFDNLQKNYPNLTQQELKLCALIKLNLSVKETSSILGISPESVKVTKYRLKKKLNLKPEQNFSAALNMFVNVSDENN